MYRIPIYKVQLVRDSSQPSTLKKVSKPSDVCDILRTYLEGADRENFVILMLDTKNQVIGINTVGVGILNACPVHPREVFKPAILSNAAGIILGHNHPSGDPGPSKDDLELTVRLKDAGDILGIAVIDHIIIGDNNRYVSLKERGTL
jgi:DNA repair protein RadC